MTPASRSGAPLGRWLGVLAASVGLVIVLVWQRRQVVPTQDAASGLRDDASTARAPGVPAGRPATSGAPVRAASPADGDAARTPPEAALGTVDPKEAWRAQAWRAVLPVVRARLGRAPTPQEQAVLLDVLGSVGPAARTLDREMLDPDDPASIARVREQTRVLVEADRTCRTMLGIGVAELLRRLEPQAVDDQGAAEP